MAVRIEYIRTKVDFVIPAKGAVRIQFYSAEKIRIEQSGEKGCMDGITQYFSDVHMSFFAGIKAAGNCQLFG